MANVESVPSVWSDQLGLLAAIEALHVPGGFEVDLTYGNGAFWKGRSRPPIRLDLEPLTGVAVQADSAAVPLRTGSVGSVVFDPPFLTYVRAGRSGNGSMLMARRFGGYWRYDELARHYVATLIEIHRVLRSNGVVVVKCQDIVHNHRLHPTGANVLHWAARVGLRLVDTFLLVADHRLPRPNRGLQRHARIHHSYFHVFRRVLPEAVVGVAL